MEKKEDTQYINGFPVYYLDIDIDMDDESGVKAVSFVNNPATKIKWEAFEGQEHITTKQVFSSDKKKQMIYSPIMLCNTPIERHSDRKGNYYVMFSEASIRKMMVKYAKSNNTHNVNLQHNKDMKLEGVFLVESFIYDDRLELNGMDVEKGTWMGSYYIEDLDLYNKLIADPDFNGFSLEGDFKETTTMPVDFEEKELSLEEQIKTIVYAEDKSDEEKEVEIRELLK